MEQRHDERMDRISNLPVEIIDAILVRLPLKDAVRTSILSSEWKDKWVTISELVFIGSCLSRETIELATIVDQVLLLHQGPLRKFFFSCFLDNNYSPIDRWISQLSRKGVKELKIDACLEECLIGSIGYKVPSHLFDCQEITSLELNFCVVKLPPSFEVFPKLKSLELYEMSWDNCDINMLTSKCPRLERLTFINSTFTSIKINNPNLEFLDISGDIAAIHFESAPLLSEISFGAQVCGSITVLSVYSILQSIFHLPNIRKLDLGVTNSLPGPLCSELKVPPTALCNLENLSMDVHFKDQTNISALFCLLRTTSSSLLKLSLRGRRYEDISVATGCFKAWKDWNCSFKKLVEVSITIISELATAALELIKVVLANSPVLQILTISSCREDVSIFKELLQFQRASPEAKIFWMDLTFKNFAFLNQGFISGGS